ncbi:hypothetical protein ACM66B_004716 [Microbotryomycetes sp. NB124-2]
MAISKAQADRNQRQLLELLKVPGNDACADCQARNPRWSAWNHGVFVCVTCAGIHRKMGTHISKVKSVSLDTWTKDQIEHMRQRGNAVVNQKLNPGNSHRPPPAGIDEGEREFQLERFIRDKYEHRAFEQALASAKTIDQMTRTTAPPPARSQTLPPPLPTLSVTVSSADTPPRPNSASLSPKHVRFRAASVPIPEGDIPRRVPSAGAQRSPAKGILRPRSASGTPNVSLSLKQRPDIVSTTSADGFHAPPANTTPQLTTGHQQSLNPFLKSIPSPRPIQPSPDSHLGANGFHQSSALALSPVTAGSPYVTSSMTMVPPTKGIWDDLDFLGGGSSSSSSSATAPVTVQSSFPAAQLSSYPTPQPPPVFNVSISSSYPQQATPAVSSPLGYRQAAPAPLTPQRTGFTPSSDFGRQLASEFGNMSLQPHTLSTSSGSVTPSRMLDSLAPSPFQPQLTGYFSTSSSSSQQQQSQVLSSNLAPTYTGTNPFLNMSNLGGGGFNNGMSTFEHQQSQQPVPQYPQQQQQSLNPFLSSTLSSTATGGGSGYQQPWMSSQMTGNLDGGSGFQQSRMLPLRYQPTGQLNGYGMSMGHMAQNGPQQQQQHQSQFGTVQTLQNGRNPFLQS